MDSESPASSNHPYSLDASQDNSVKDSCSNDRGCAPYEDADPIQSKWTEYPVIYKYIRWLFSIDGIVSIAFLCNILTLSLPVLLVPIAIEENYRKYQTNDDDDNSNNTMESIASVFIAGQVARVSSMAFLGGALGKIVNGFICVEMGPYACSRWYLAGLALCGFIMPLTNSTWAMGMAWAGLEFFSSVQYSAMAVMLSNFYESDPIKLSTALTARGLASNIGEILSKIMVVTLCTFFHWRTVANVGAGIALFGWLVISNAPGRQAAEEAHSLREPFHWYSVVASLRAILGSSLFWKLAVPYSMVFVACYTDRLLVPFYFEMTSMSQNFCGGLTLSVTFGLIHGLMTGSATYTHLQEVGQKKAFFRNRYVGNVVSALALMALAHSGPTMIANPIVLASLVFFFSAMMASTVAFHFFQLPAMIAQRYPDHKPVCLSFLDGFGYLLSIPVFSVLGTVVPNFGWEAGWGLLAVLFAIAGTVMVGYLGPVLDSAKFFSDEDDLGAFFSFDWASAIYCGSPAAMNTEDYKKITWLLISSA